MARVVHSQNNFTAGELTPRMNGRGDVARYQNGAETIQNGFVVVHGGVMRRYGTRYLAATKFSGASKSRLIRYVFDVDHSYMLEFGNGYVRVFDGTTGAVMLNDALAVLEITSPYSSDQLPQITTKQSADVMFIFHPDVQPYQLRRLSQTQWVLIPVPWTVVPFAELGHQPNAALTLSSASVGTGRTFTTAPTAAPNAPTIGTATPYNAAASVTFTPPSGSGGSAITSYTATSTPGGITATGTASPITVTGLTNGTNYTFKVAATNAVGTGPQSAASNSVKPLGSLPGTTLTVTADTTSFFLSVPAGTQAVEGPTASASGGSSPYTYAWTQLSGDEIYISRANTARVQITSDGIGADNFATLRCTVTDSNGAAGTVDVNITIRHRLR